MKKKSTRNVWTAFLWFLNIYAKYNLNTNYTTSTTNYAWDLNKPIHLSLLSYDTMSSLSLCELARLETSREQ